MAGDRIALVSRQVVRQLLAIAVAILLWPLSVPIIGVALIAEGLAVRRRSGWSVRARVSVTVGLVVLVLSVGFVVGFAQSGVTHNFPSRGTLVSP